jgi:hypothetical protein
VSGDDRALDHDGEAIMPVERQFAVALLLTILEHADPDLVEEIVRDAIDSVLRCWMPERHARTGAAADEPLTYAGVWRGGDPVWGRSR